MGEGLYHANINVLNKETLLDAGMAHPEDRIPAVDHPGLRLANFTKLTREQQLDVLSRTSVESV
ncbi:MAG: autonomous glycyl radical cofactor GrcA [Micropruina glycogenica]